jgi:hypothetical protein
VGVLLDGDDADAPRNRAQLPERAPGLRSVFRYLGGWGPVQGGIVPETAADQAAAMCAAFGLDFWAANIEAPGVVARFWHRWQDLGGPAPLALFCTGAVDGEYAPAVAARSAIVWELYGNDDPALTVDAMRNHLMWEGVPESLIVPAFGVWDAGREIPWNDYRRWAGPSGIYPAERLKGA